MPTSETRKMVLVAAAVCDDKKAQETRILELDAADAGFTDFFLITSGNNTRQTVAIADDIELKMKREFGTYPNSVEGRRVGEWILMDYVDFVVHIFTEEKRAFYDIERLRKSARSLDATQLQAALTEKTVAARKAHPVPAGAPGSTKKEPGAAAKKTAGKKQSAPRKTAVRKTAARKTAPRKTAAKKTAATTKTGSSPARKTPAKKSSTRTAAANEALGRAGAAAKKTPAKRAPRKSTRSPEE
ncbi:MAG TPA: ribosome silencing factor [Acidobacteriaceae bacterium]